MQRVASNLGLCPYKKNRRRVLFIGILQRTLAFIFLNACYVKLQQAYISEAVAFGSWKIIGHKGLGDNTVGTNGGSTSSTTNFNYKNIASDFIQETLSLSQANSAKVGFTAANKAKLNDSVKRQTIRPSRCPTALVTRMVHSRLPRIARN